MCGPAISNRRLKKLIAENSGSELSVITVAANTTLTQHYGLVLVSGDTDVTLPAPGSVTGRPFTFKNMDNGTQRILPPLGVDIEFGSLLTNNTKGDTWTVVSDGTQYLVL